MNEAKKCGKLNPKQNANFFGRITFWWLIDLFRYGRKHNLVASDLYDVLPKHRSDTLGDVLEKSWNKELDQTARNGNRPSFQNVIVRTYGWNFLKYALFLVLYITTVLAMPLLLEQLLRYFQPNSPISSTQAYSYATIVALLMIVQSVSLRYGFFTLMTNIGMNLRIAASSLVYRKLLKLSSSSASGNNAGRVISLMTGDVIKFEFLASTVPFIVLAPLELLITTYILWRYVRIAAIVGVSLMVLQTIPMQTLFYRITSKFRKKLTTRLDQRIQLISEVINGIRTIKMFVWEKSFEKLIFLARRREIDVLMKIALVTGMTAAWTVFSYRLATFATILATTLLYGKISAITIVSATQYLFNIRTSMSIFLSNALKLIAESKITVQRIENFLLLDEVQSIVKKIENTDSNVSVIKVTTSWKKDAKMGEMNLRDINIDVSSGELVVVIGPVGAGKSSLLKLILGELEPISGEVFVNGSISYTNQEPWVFPASVQENILFGKKYDEERYTRVVKACALLEDFGQLPYGDKTLLGERGSNLSGGQCARVNMARAVYRETDICLFDDPLSAVDAHVAKKLFENCINGLLKDKTRILVTHNIEYLKEANTIILLNRGAVEFQGTFTDFQKTDKYFSYLPLDIETEEAKLKKKDKKDKGDDGNVIVIPKIVKRKDNEPKETEELLAKGFVKRKDNEPKETEELLAKGFIKRSIYWKYIQGGATNFTLFLLLLTFILGVLSIAGFDYWMVTWTKEGEIRYRNLLNTSNITNLEDTQFENFLYVTKSMYICGGLIAAILLASMVLGYLVSNILLNSNENLHNKMFASLMRTPLKFFELNPFGRILNRFSRDTNTVDDQLIKSMFDSLFNGLSAVAIILPVLIIKWWSILPIGIFMYFYFQICNIYTKIAQEIKRLDGTSKSPVLSFVTTSLSGLLTIRSCKSQELVTRAFDSRQDHHTSAHFLSCSAISAFSMWMEILTYVLWASVGYVSLALKNDETYVSDVSLVLLQLRSVVMVLQFTMRQVADIMGQMINVERMFQFVKLEREEECEIENQIKLDKNWPDKGEVVFDRLYLRYAEDDEPVLKDLSFKISAGIKVGIVGRTGAGKSSLIAALFRLAKIDGSLLIDDVDTKKISLSDLRSHISIIPQEPALFSASLRDNLDPRHEFDDASLWSALENVELSKQFDSLDHVIDREGGVLSSGQRQLLCLARAIVKRNKILVLDEATANVDPATDELIQKTIRIVFKDCTVLTIAHRLNTIIDSDKVLVMDNGEVVEFDHPHILLQQKDGYFSKIVEETGSSMSRYLNELAEQAFKQHIIDTGNRS